MFHQITSVQKRVVQICIYGAVLSFPAFAGQIYGTIISQGKPLAKADIVITCTGEDTKGATADDGTFKIMVAKTGRCSFGLPTFAGKPSAVVFSQAKPAMFDFDLVKDAAGNYELKIR